MVQFVTKRRETKSLRGGLCIDEDEARFYFLQLLSAVEYCHKHHVAHRWGGGTLEQWLEIGFSVGDVVSIDVMLCLCVGSGT